MRIGIIGAMDEEIALYLDAMEQKETTEKAGIAYHAGKLEGMDVVLCKSGVGKVNAAVCTQILIDRFEVGQIIFTGVAGAVHPELNIGDIVVSTDCVQQDMDVTALGFAPGQIPYTEKWTWEAEPSLIQQAIQAAEQVSDEVRVVKGRILTGDQFIADPERVSVLYEKFGGSCIEMEGASVAQVCSMNQIPFVIVRSMSDKADGSAHVNFVEFTHLASRRSFEIVSEMLRTMAAQGPSAAAIVYSTKGCIECDMVKQMLTQAGVPFEVRDVMTKAEYRDEVERFGFLGVPVTVVNGQAVKGFEPEALNRLIAEARK